jgi:hypothetical protein
MTTANFISRYQNANRFTKHAAVCPELGAATGRAPDGAAAINRIDAAKYYLADLELGPISVVNRIDQSVWIQSGNCLGSGFDLRLADVIEEVALRRDIRGVHAVKVHELQSRSTDSGKLQCNLPTNRADADYRD